MSDRLREAMRDLAEEAKPVRPSDDTWRRGRRSRALRMAGAALATVLVATGGVLTWTEVGSSTSPQPASTTYDPNALAIPDRLSAPSPWTPGTDDAGPLGPLAVIASSPRQTSWFHTADAEFGVSAVTGEYRFLDLPDEARDTGFEPVLSPDGLRVAYFVSGRPTSPAAPSDVVGYAVYNSVTGDVERHLVQTRFGLQPNSLTWSGDSRAIVASFDQSSREEGRNLSVPAQAWDLRTGRVLTLHPRYLVSLNVTAPAPDGVAVFQGSRPAVIDPVTGAVHDLSFRPASLPGLVATSGPMLDPAGSGVVFTGNVGEAMGPRIFHADWSNGDESPTVAEVPGSRPWILALYGWADADHLLVEKWATGYLKTGRGQAPVIYRLDLHTGALTPAITIEGTESQWIGDPKFASNLFLRPVASRPGPASPHDPRVVWGLVAGGVPVLLVGLLWLSRRRTTRPLGQLTTA
jgi:hypothetical protein